MEEVSSQAPSEAAVSTPEGPYEVTGQRLQEAKLEKSVSLSQSFVEDGCVIAPLITPIDISIENVSYSVKDGKGQKKILDNISGRVKSGTMVALMGASGSGKTSLLNILSRRNRRNTGRVLFNGFEMDEKVVSRMLAYVQQEDIFFGTLTVREHLMIQAKLRLPPSISKAERVQRVENIIYSLGLAKCADSQIGNILMSEGRGISGGEKKRLNIATELLMAPAVIFADEVTTGLDSFVAHTAVRALRNFADKGRTVICTIHQPSARIFEMFDQLILLSYGRIVYFGDRLAALAWFSRLGRSCPVSNNPAEYLIKIVAVRDHKTRDESMERIMKWCDVWNEKGAEFSEEWNSGLRDSYLAQLSKLRQDTMSMDASGRAISLEDYTAQSREMQKSLTSERINSRSFGATKLPNVQNVDSEGVAGERLQFEGRINPITETAILTWRSFLVDSRNAVLLIMRVVQLAIFGTFLGFVYFRLGWDQAGATAKLGAAYMVMMNMAMMNAMTVSNRVPLDVPVVRGEYRAGALRVASYAWGKMLSDIPIQLLSCFLFATVAYWMVGFNDNGVRYILMVTVVILTAFGATSLGYLASCLASSVPVALAITQTFLLPMILVSGFAVRLDDIPKFWIWLKYISVLRYGFGSLCRVIFIGETIYLTDGTTASGEQFLDFLSLDSSKQFFVISIIALIAVTIVVRLLASLALSLRMWSSKSR